MKAKGWILAGIAALLMAEFVAEPVLALKSAKEGLSLFLGVVLPSLLPFMVCAGLFIESGAASAAGSVLNRFMRPVFACPGASAFALTAGMLSGYPTGARLTLDLAERGLCPSRDVERSGILASACGPVFMMGAVGAGLLCNPAAGWLIALSHWSAVVLTGLLFSIGGDRRRDTQALERAPETPAAMGALGNSIKKTVETLWAVGGYIILFSVVSGLFEHFGILTFAASLVSPLLGLLGLEPALAKPLVIGAIEMTNGCNAVALASATIQNRCAAVALLVSFGGLCIQAQSLLFLTQAGVRAWFFVLSKVVQAALAFLMCRFLAQIPAFDSALCMGGVTGQGFSPAWALLSSAAYTAGWALAFAVLAMISARASTRGSA